METKVELVLSKKMLENLRKENTDISKDSTCSRDTELENRMLKPLIQSIKEDKDKVKDDLKEKNQDIPVHNKTF